MSDRQSSERVGGTAMSVERFCIVLDHPSACYLPGQDVCGRVELWTTRTKTIKAIQVFASGDARVYWTETEINPQRSRIGSGSQNAAVAYSSSESYFQHRNFILHKGGESFELNAGRHEFPFKFSLPTQLAPSFEGEFGRVRYSVKVLIQRSWKLDLECKKVFTVNTAVDLNFNDMASMPVQGTESRSRCCLCCVSRPIEARAWLDHLGYVPGQKILFSAQVDNRSGGSASGSKVKLVQYSTFHATTKSRTSKRTLCKLEHGSFALQDVWDRQVLVVPPLPPSDLPFCNIMTVKYRLQFVVDPGPVSQNLKIPLNIFVGNVPLRQHFATLENAAVSSSQLENPLAALPGHIFPSDQYPDLPPATYRKLAPDHVVDIREEGDSKQLNNGTDLLYSPLYLTYHQEWHSIDVSH